MLNIAVDDFTFAIQESGLNIFQGAAPDREELLQAEKINQEACAIREHITCWRWLELQFCFTSQQLEQRKGYIVYSLDWISHRKRFRNLCHALAIRRSDQAQLSQPRICFGYEVRSHNIVTFHFALLRIIDSVFITPWNAAYDKTTHGCDNPRYERLCAYSASEFNLLSQEEWQGTAHTAGGGGELLLHMIRTVGYFSRTA